MKKSNSVLCKLKSDRWDPLWIFLICAVCFSWALGSAPLAGTEGFRALTADQMLHSGDWLVPRLYGQLYLRKPPMMYWFLAGAEMLAGRGNEWVWRLPSALGAALLGAFLAHTARRWWGRAAGLAAGVAFLSLAALWSQFRSADIDALNTLFAFIVVIALFELMCDAPRRRFVWMLFGGVALGVSLLLKGPASLPLVLGALIAPPLLSGRFKRFLSPAVWGVILIGGLIFGAYMLSVMNRLDTFSGSAATSGLREAGDQMTISSWRELGSALVLPIELLLFALPPALALIFVLRRTFLGRIDEDSVFILRSLVGTFVIACAIGVVTGIDNPRYAYIILPLFALPVGLLAGQIAQGRVGNREVRLVNKMILGLVMLLGLAGVGISVFLIIKIENSVFVLLAVGSIAAGYAAVHAWRKASQTLLYLGLVVALFFAAIGFDYIKNIDRSARSGRAAGLVMRETTGEDAEVTTGLMLWTHPEIFHYAGVKVDARNRWEFAAPFDLDRDGWVLFHPREWELWSKEWPERLSRSQELPTHVPGAVLAWYSAPKG